MATTYTINVGLGKPALADLNWNVPINANVDRLDSLTAIGGLCVRTNEIPSATLNVKISAGTFVNSGRTTTAYGGTVSYLLAASSTNYLYLNDDGTLGSSTTAWPSAVHVPLAIVVTGASSITSVTDARTQCASIGPGLGSGSSSFSGPLSLTFRETPSTSLNVSISPGVYMKANGTVGSYAGVTSQLVPASSTTKHWLTDAGVLTSGSAYPSTAHVRIGTVVAGSSVITSVSDDRVVTQTLQTSGGGYVQKSGDTVTGNFTVSTLATGTPLMTLNSVSRLIGFFDSTPASQASAVSSLTISVGTGSDSMVDAGGSYSQTNINNNFRSLTDKVNLLIAAIKRHGLMGS